jgi:hypothetical protein
MIARLLKPSRLALALLAVVALAILGTRALGSDPVAAGKPKPTQQLLDPDEAEAAAERFVDLWCELGGRTPQQWAAAMRAVSTPETRDQWTPNLASNLTGDCFYGNTAPRRLSSYEAVERVDTKRGRPVLVTVQQVGDQVLVANIGEDDQYEGDV